MSLYGSSERIRELMRSSQHWPSLILPPGPLARLGLLLDDSLFPLGGFMTRDAVDACMRRSRLPDGSFWPVAVSLEVPATTARVVEAGACVVLRDGEGTPLAILRVEDRWASSAPDVDHLGGPVEGLTPPRHYDFQSLRLLPHQVRAEIARRGWTSAVALQTDRVPRPADLAYLRQIVDQPATGLLLQAIVAPDGPNNDRHYDQVRGFQRAVETLGADRAQLTLLPLTLDRSGGRGVALAALIARNYGCTHVVADPTLLASALQASGVSARELGVRAIEPGPLATAGDVGDLDARPRHEQGVTVFFTGLSGSGKSTIANAVRALLLERGDRRVTLLDGDLVRRHLSSELGFSREHRDLNIRRIGFVAAEITKHGGIAICAPIAPYASTRREVRRAVEQVGGFVLVFVDTPLDVCESRDPKGLYARARAGIIPEFTGISDPYEAPDDAELVIDTTKTDAAGAAKQILAYLAHTGYLS